MSITQEMAILTNTKENLRLALGLDSNVPFSDYVEHLNTEWSPSELFSEGQQGFWYEPNDISTLFQDAAGLVPVTNNKEPIGRMQDKSGNDKHAVQLISARRMMYKVSPPRFVSDNVDDAFVISIPTDGWIGEVIIATDVGTAVYKTTLPAGQQYILNHKLFPQSGIIGALFREGGFTDTESSLVIKYFVSKGAVESYINTVSLYSMWDSGTYNNFPLIDTSSAEEINFAWRGNNLIESFPLIDLSNAKQARWTWANCTRLTSFPAIDLPKSTSFEYTWYRCSGLTSFPLIDLSSAETLYQVWQGCQNLTSFPPINTSKVRGFSNAWSDCKSLVSFPFIDVSSGNMFSAAWYNCSSLTDFPANMFDNIKGANFSNAFAITNLSQESIDGILTSLVTSGIATGTRVFVQSGGSAPSAIGEAAIDTLRSRGWSITVTGKY